jgi:hypothetical protein
LNRAKRRAAAGHNRVTDHALVRWLERAHDVDMPGFRVMLHDIVGDAIDAGATAVRHDGLLYVIEGGRLITVRPA